MTKASLGVPRCAVLALLLAMAATSVWAAGECDPMPKAIGPITAARKITVPGEKPPTNPTLGEARVVALGDWIAVDVNGLSLLLKEAKCRNKLLIVYLNGQPMKDITPSTSANPNELHFRLLRTNGNRQAWGEILGYPDIAYRPLNMTVGVEGEPPLTGANGGISISLSTVTVLPILVAGLCFLGLFIGFLYLLRRSNILRDASPPEDAVAIVNGKFDPGQPVTHLGTYSLAKSQAAWWFFIVVGAYLLIGIVTWDFYSSISSTALILLGIGAGTVVGGTFIDVSKDTPDAADARAKRAAELKLQIVQLNAAQEYCRLYARSLDAMAPPASNNQPLSPQETLTFTTLIHTHGPDMVQWLRTGFGSTYTTIADIFELQTLSQGAAAATSPPSPQLAKLQAAYAGLINDLCQLKALTAAGAPIPLPLQHAKVPSFSSMMRKESDLTIEKSTLISRYRKLTKQSEGWFVDILSDVNGVSFHRFQLFSWTVILGGVFMVNTYRELNMPVFDTTLMGLLGLSAATYLGLKVPEPTIPTK